MINFFSLILNARPFAPITTILIKIVSALIQSENEPDKIIEERIKFIYENTDKKIKMDLPTIELLVFRNLDKGINYEIDIGDNSFKLFELYNILDAISKELTTLVIKTAKKYSIDIPLGVNITGGQQNFKIDLDEGKNG